MKKKSAIHKGITCFRILFVITMLYCTPKTVFAQDSLHYPPEDSLLFAQRIENWKTLELPADSLAEWQASVVVAVFFEKMNRIVLAFEPELDSLRQALLINDTLLLEAKRDSSLSPDSLKTRIALLKSEKATLKTLETAQKKRVKQIQWAEKLRLQSAKSQKKQLATLIQKWQSLLPPIPEPPPTVEKPAPVEIVEVAMIEPAPPQTPDLGIAVKKKKEKIKIVRYNPEKDVMFHPAERPCTLAIQRTDPFTGATYKETQKAELFRNTNAVLRKMLADTQAHIICKAALSNEPATGGGSLHLVFTIKDANARRTFGGLPAKSYLSLKFMDGEIITLFNDINQEIQMDLATSTAVFQGRYGFQAALLKSLMKKELDSVRVAWSTGYEDYSVYNVGLLQEMAECLFR